MRCSRHSRCMNSGLISYGTSKIISSTHRKLSTTARRSSSFSTGGPLHRRISSSGTRPTMSSSPHALAWRRALAWPKCARSKHPSIYTRTGRRFLLRAACRSRALAAHDDNVPRLIPKKASGYWYTAKAAVTAAIATTERRSTSRSIPIIPSAFATVFSIVYS